MVAFLRGDAVFSLDYFMEQLVFPLEYCGPNPKRLMEFCSMIFLKIS